jgi:rhodanese-related sulfurtransferase
MKPPISFGIKTVIIIGLSVGLALAFNATRPDRLPLVHDPEVAAQAAAQRGEISLADAVLLFESGEAVFVDAREAGEYELGHIEGALSLDPLSFGQNFPALREQLEGTTTIVTYCDGEYCELSRELAEQLESMGLQDVRVLKNGWTLWLDQGLPTATGSWTAPEQTPSMPTNEEETPPAEQSNGTAPTGAPLETPMEAGPLEPAPLDPPIEPTIPDQAPLDAAPAEPAPLDRQQEPAPQEQPSLDSAPLEPTPLETAPLEAVPMETAPEEPATQSPPLDSKPQGDKS